MKQPDYAAAHITLASLFTAFPISGQSDFHSAWLKAPYNYALRYEVGLVA
jgi:hypothetical protein